MNCYSTTLIAKLHCNIYSIVVKYRHTFCLHVYFFGVSGFHKCFFNISSVRSLSPQAMKDSSHLISTFIVLSSLLLTLVTIPQHHIYLFSSSSSGYEKTHFNMISLFQFLIRPIDLIHIFYPIPYTHLCLLSSLSQFIVPLSRFKYLSCLSHYGHCDYVHLTIDPKPSEHFLYLEFQKDRNDCEMFQKAIKEKNRTARIILIIEFL